MRLIGINYLAVLLAAIAAWCTGALWYTVFGKQWLAAIGRTKKDMNKMKPGTFGYYAPFLLAFIANLLIAFMLAGVMFHVSGGQMTLRGGLISAVLVWLGFVATTIVVNNAFAGRKPMVSLIDAGHWLAAMLVSGLILGALGK